MQPLSTFTCYCILAPKLSLGISDTNSKRTLNLSQLKCNSRSCIEKKSGRKHPRLHYTDVTINPAPDSELKDIFTNVPRKHNCHEPKFWTNETLCVNMISEKRVTKDEEWLSSDHMSAIKQLLREHCVSVNVLQDTTLVPLKKKSKLVFNRKGFKTMSTPSANIHYNGNHHLVTFFSM